MGKTKLWWNLGVTIVAVSQASQLIAPIINNKGISTSDYVSFALLLLAVGLIAYAWITEYRSAPIKVISSQVCVDTDGQKPQIQLFITLLSNEDISLKKNIELATPKCAKQTIIISPGYRLNREQDGDFISLKSGVAVDANDRKYIQFATDNETSINSAIVELSNKLNMNCYSIKYETARGKSYIYKPKIKKRYANDL